MQISSSSNENRKSNSLRRIASIGFVDINSKGIYDLIYDHGLEAANSIPSYLIIERREGILSKPKLDLLLNNDVVKSIDSNDICKIGSTNNKLILQIDNKVFSNDGFWSVRVNEENGASAKISIQIFGFKV